MVVMLGGPWTCSPMGRGRMGRHREAHGGWTGVWWLVFISQFCLSFILLLLCPCQWLLPVISLGAMGKVVKKLRECCCLPRLLEKGEVCPASPSPLGLGEWTVGFKASSVVLLDFSKHRYLADGMMDIGW